MTRVPLWFDRLTMSGVVRKTSGIAALRSQGLKGVKVSDGGRVGRWQVVGITRDCFSGEERASQRRGDYGCFDRRRRSQHDKIREFLCWKQRLSIGSDGSSRLKPGRSAAFPIDIRDRPLGWE